MDRCWFAMMLPRWFVPVLVCTLLVHVGVAEASVPTLVSAASRKLHAGVAYDTPLMVPNTNPPTLLNTIECRLVSGTPGTTLVLSFDQPVNAGTATLTFDTGGAGSVGTVSFSNNQMLVPLNALNDAHIFTLTAHNVAAADGSGTLGSLAVSLRTLQGDVNGNAVVSGSDVNITKVQVGQPVTGANYRCDINANGNITGSDVNLIKVKVGGAGVAGGPMTNTAPTIGTIADQSITNDAASVPLGFAVADAESDPATLAVSGTSDNQTLLPNSGIILGGSGASRTISLSAAAAQTGSCNVTVSVSDGLLTTSTAFNVTVTNGNTLYIATMTPEGGALSSGTGSATLLVSGDQTHATLRFQYSNLSSAEVAEHVHLGAPGANGPIIYDIDTPAPPSPPGPNADGSHTWVFAQSGNFSVQDQLNAIQQGNTYLNIHTVNYPGGEIRGQFALAQGSQTFTPPAEPPPLPTGPVTSNDAARFLTQATFGPALADINTLAASANNTAGDGTTNAYDSWLNTQFATTATLMYPVIKNRAETPQNGNAYGDPWVTDRTYETWWKNALTAPDQLRQRVAFAYSEIFVVSAVDGNVNGNPWGVASYHDMLANDAFGNFRKLLEDVTLHATMGDYLNMRGNGKQTLPAKPNENYAREVLQLFSVGLNNIFPDGTLQLDANGLPIPTYDQSVVEGFAQVFTGWDYDPSSTHWVTINQLNPPDSTHTTVWTQAITDKYHTPMIPKDGNHSVYQKQLLNGVIIAADSSPSANGDLKTALDNIFNHPNVGPFIARRLIQRLVGSTPSPGYVYRVARVFNNDTYPTAGGTRGNMQAVIRAILTDYEARSPAVLSNQGYGHLREPLLRASATIRAFHPSSNSGEFKLSRTETSLFQSAYYSPTVFNYFTPDYIDPGVVAAAGLFSPELQIATENSNVTYINTMYNGVYNTNSGWPGGDVSIHLDVADSGGTSEQTLAGSDVGAAGGLLDRLNLLLMQGSMPATMRSRIATYVNSLPTGTTALSLARARAAVNLVVGSTQFSTQK